jgi:hypothetical protein
MKKSLHIFNIYAIFPSIILQREKPIASKIRNNIKPPAAAGKLHQKHSLLVRYEAKIAKKGGCTAQCFVLVLSRTATVLW